MNDKELEKKICVDCGSTVYITHGHVRRKPSDYKWRCKSCMSKHRSEMQKNSPTNISKIIKKKMEEPVGAEQIRQMMRENQKKMWESKTEEEKKAHIEKLQAGLQKAWEDNFEEYKQHRLNNINTYYRNRSKSEAKKHRKKLSKAKKEFFANLSDEDKARFSEIYKSAWNNKSDESKEVVRQKSIEQWKNMTDVEYEAIRKHMSESQQKRWEKMTDDERYEISKIHQDLWKAMTDEEKYEKMIKTFSKTSATKNSLNELFELTFHNSYISKEFYIVSEVVSINNEYSKSWDYGIYNKNNELVMLVDLDGSYFHADNCDYDGIHSREEYDEKRFLSIPDGVKYCIIYEKDFKKSFQNMIQLLKIDYEEFILSIFNYCRSIDFPYPKYKKDELLKSYSRLEKMDPSDKYHQSPSLNTRVGDRIITHFHPSIYHAHRQGKPSPYNAWYNDKLLKDCIENRVIYVNELNPNKILQGFNISKIAPKVSVFSAGRAKILIYKYLKEYDTIFDPFSGFGGRMLGALSLDKFYIGNDLSSTYVEENMNICRFLNLEEKVLLTSKDILSMYGKYECLFTCPPYDDKEIWSSKKHKAFSCDDWIDICLSHFKCKRYLFVVDDTKKYKSNIVDIIMNKSHFSKNSELLLLFNKEE